MENGGVSMAFHDPTYSDSFYRDALEYGHFEAILRSMDRSGIPRQPPLGWIPEHPDALLFADERKR
jgi:hypothetical protein